MVRREEERALSLRHRPDPVGVQRPVGSSFASSRSAGGTAMERVCCHMAVSTARRPRQGPPLQPATPRYTPLHPWAVDDVVGQRGLMPTV